MASALLVSRDEARDQQQHQARWGERKVYMRKGPGKAASKPGFDSQEVSRVRLQSGRPREGPARVMAGHEMFDAAASDDSSSLNRKSISVNHEARKDVAAMNTAAAAGWSNVDSFVTFNVSSYSKQGIRELKRKLSHELELVRNLYARIEAREAQLRVSYCQSGGVNVNASYSASQFSGNDMRNYGGKEVTSELAPGGHGQRETKPGLQLNLSAIDRHMTAGDGAAVAKEKRTPKANQYYRNSEFVMGKDKMPLADNKKAANKRSAQGKIDCMEAKRAVFDLQTGKQLAEVMKQCGAVLTKLMKQKPPWVFNSPVDTVGLRLHDYHTIIKHPMDLGTVKSKLAENQYNTPLEFAEDVRLTFNNAMTYNPKGHEVNTMAERLLQFFEDRWKPIYEKYEEDKRKSWSEGDRTPLPSQNVKKLPFLEPPKKNLKKLEPLLRPSPPHQSKMKTKSNSTLVRTPAPKKPKAKDPNKREMSNEEKQKLSTSLQNLPPEKSENIVQIIKKRNPALCQNEGVIEVDIDSFDTETLWELDRFVNNCKKAMSKNKRKAIAGDLIQPPNNDTTAGNKSPVAGLGESAKKNKKGEQGEEDVEIDDDMPSTNFPPVEIEKDGGYASSSSSSSSDSGSSSSDSDSGSSSGSDSEGDDDHSPGVGSKVSPAS